MHFRSIFSFIGVINFFISLSVCCYALAVSLEVSNIYFFADVRSGFLLGIPLFSSLLMSSLHGSPFKDISGRDAILLVALSWLTMVLISAVPYVLEGMKWPDAIFESASGFSTTGATVIKDFSRYSKSLMMWRSFTQWMGGMGIIVFFISVIPALGMAGKRLFRSEVPGPVKEALTPHIKDTTRVLWMIYLGFTIILIIALFSLGLSFYDAVTHAFATISTGGFSPYAKGVADFSPALQGVIIFFMVVAGTNFSIFVGFFHSKSLKVFRDTEFIWYLLFLFVVSFLVSIGCFFSQSISLLAAFQRGFFTVVSLVTTTGFVVADYELFPLPLQTLLLVCFFCGGCASSTAGGLKFYRLIIFFRSLSLEIKNSFFPEFISSLRINHKVVSREVMDRIFIFVSVYFTSVGLTCLIFFADGNDFFTAFTAAASCIGNIGPAFGTTGPTENFAHFSGFSKIVASWAMILGRLEFFTILTVFHSFFWKRN